MLPRLWLRRTVQVSLLVSALLLGACTSDGASPANDSSTIPAVTIELDGEAVDDTAEVPAEYVTAALNDVADRTSTDVANLTVLDSSVVEWANARLGCVQFDDATDSGPVNGYRIVVATDSAQYDYRLGSDGVPRLCGDPVESAPPDDDDHDDDEPLEAETE